MLRTLIDMHVFGLCVCVSCYFQKIITRWGVGYTKNKGVTILFLIDLVALKRACWLA